MYFSNIRDLELVVEEDGDLEDDEGLDSEGHDEEEHAYDKNADASKSDEDIDTYEGCGETAVDERGGERRGVGSEDGHASADDEPQEEGCGPGEREGMNGQASRETISADQESDQDEEHHTDAPIILKQASGSQTIVPPTAHTSTKPPAPAVTPVVLPPEGSEAQLIDGPPTRAGRKRRVREWGSECECGERVPEDLRATKQGVVQCKWKGCETEWVSILGVLQAET